MSKSLLNLITMHLKEFYRDPEILVWTLLFPLATAYILGVAFSGDNGSQHRIAIISESVSVSEMQELSDTLETAKANGQKFEIVKTDQKEAEKLFRRGRVAMILFFTEGKLKARLDPGNKESYSAFLLLDSILYSKDGIELIPETKKGSRYIDFLIPGLIAMGVMNSVLWGVGYGIIEFRMKSLLRRLAATPMKKWEFFLSYFIVRNFVTFIEALILIGFATAVFGFAIQGSIPAFILFFIAGNFAFSGIAILVASRAKNTRIGNGIVNAVTMPLMVLSGIFFSYQNFPEAVIPFLEKLPLAVLADGLRMITNEGAGFVELFYPTLYLFGIGLVGYFAGLRLFRWS